MNLIKLLTPSNLTEEEEKYFASSNYQPQFQYDWDSNEAKTWIERNPRYKDLYQALLDQNYIGIIEKASALFCVQIEDSYSQLAKSITSESPKKLQSQSINQISDAFEKAFQFLGLSGYKVKVVNQQGFYFRPQPSKKRIVMSVYAKFDFFSIDGEVKHELAHVIRYENGKANNLQPSDAYLPTEEGLATYCQDYTGENGSASLFQHAAEYSATEVALKGSLRDTIEYLREIGFSKELAWQRAVRHKFGWIDTSRPGDIMKPSMYFYHEQIIEQLNSEERYRLFVGKINLDELNEYPSYDGIIPLEKLRYFYQWEN